MRQRGAREHFGDEGGGGAKHMESEAEITPTDDNDHPALGQEKRMWSLACPPHELSTFSGKFGALAPGFALRGFASGLPGHPQLKARVDGQRPGTAPPFCPETEHVAQPQRDHNPGRTRKKDRVRGGGCAAGNRE